MEEYLDTGEVIILDILSEEAKDQNPGSFPNRSCKVNKNDYEKVKAINSKAVYYWVVRQEYRVYITGKDPVPLGLGVFNVVKPKGGNRKNIVYSGPVQDSSSNPYSELMNICIGLYEAHEAKKRANEIIVKCEETLRDAELKEQKLLEDYSVLCNKSD